VAISSRAPGHLTTASRTDGDPLKALALALLMLISPIATTTTASGPAAYQWYVPILTYHFTVCAPPGTPVASRYLYVCPDLFRAQLQAISDDGWTFITAAQLGTLFMANVHPAPKTLVLTIDGTDKGDYDVAFPILRDLGIKATFFVSPGRLGRPGLETWDDLKIMRQDFQDIENHGMYHLELTKLHGDALLHEIADASDAIEAALGYRPSVICYANGFSDAEVRAATRKVSGLKIAPSTHAVTPHSTPLEDSTKPLQIIRLSARPVSPLQLLGIIRPYIDG
jgi:peptidoglycan/xylan/chitin deacetylase (PgdA/CDA1 family)